MLNVSVCGIIILDWKVIIDLAGFILAVTSLFLLFYAEWMRRPLLEFIQHKDEPTPEDQKRGYMWYHLKVKNVEPKIFNRDTALQCIARVDFLDKNTKRPLVNQITAHWANQPEPKILGHFDASRIPTCQRIDVGFREEMFDVLIKPEGEKSFYAADPWAVYQEHPEWEKLKIDTSECIVKAELEAINLGKRKVAFFILRNKGTRMEDIEILPLDS